MAQSPPVNASDYYQFFPVPHHQVGDIWTDLPTLGMLGISHVTGIVITPACDLQNCKTDTITYIPIISVRLAFTTRAFLPNILKAINGQAEALGLEGLEENYSPIAPLDKSRIDEFARRVRDKLQNGRTHNNKEKSAAERVMAGVSILAKGCELPIKAPSGTELKLLFGARFDDVVERIVTNSAKADIHFLPTDGQRREWSAIAEPSVALFRYVVSAPIEIFDCAQDTSNADWEHEIKRMSSTVPGARAFSRQPMKRQTLKPRFAADLLTRYVAMHVRLGAPDFTEASIRNYVSDVIGTTE